MAAKTTLNRSGVPTAPEVTPILDADTACLLARLGRTEDLRFSPNCRKLALAGYAANCCLILNVDIDCTAPAPRIAITGATEFSSGDLCDPHGFDFVDDQTLVVANRGGCVAVFDLPHSATSPIRIAARHRITRASWTRRLHSPGSVLVSSVDDAGFELLVCNNYRNRVTQHRIAHSGGQRNRILLQRGLKVPDGITQTPDCRWLAVSNHFTASVQIYDRTKLLNHRSASHGQLTGTGFPHGVRFSPDGRHAFVADAGAPLVHVFHAPDGQWQGDHAPRRSVRVLSEQVFRRGRTNEAEGGPKGLDIDATGHILAVTCEEQPLAFFAIADLI
ncbi:MAG: hypothetical protein GKR99_06045 [Rhodobacteraceae bacterium]|nr:hypothetical protein [Paracoccaceae bacterium]